MSEIHGFARWIDRGFVSPSHALRAGSHPFLDMGYFGM